MKNKVEEPALNYKFVPQEDYLESEREALEKHEYYQGEVFAMSGASAKRNRIFTNLFVDIGSKLKGKGCIPYSNDLRIHIPKNTLYTYPDISIICGEMEFTDDKFDTAANPSVIIEILSNSIRNYDMGEKFTLYRDIDTLQEYILIDSEKVYVEKHIRNADNSWQLTDHRSIENSFIISTINQHFLLKDIYEGISFE